VAENGKQALYETSKSTFDLILMDIMMPEMDGFEASKKIRKPEEEKDQCLAAGMDSFIEKPLTKKKLTMQLEQLNIKVSAS